MKYKLADFVKILLLALFVLSFSNTFSQEIPTDAASISAGEALFNGNCKSCHRVDKKLVGPALKDIENRAPSIRWIFRMGEKSRQGNRQWR